MGIDATNLHNWLANNGYCEMLASYAAAYHDGLDVDEEQLGADVLGMLIEYLEDMREEDE